MIGCTIRGDALCPPGALPLQILRSLGLLLLWAGRELHLAAREAAVYLRGCVGAPEVLRFRDVSHLFGHLQGRFS